MKTTFLLTFFVSFALFSAANAEPKVEIESTYDSQSNLLTRLVTPGTPNVTRGSNPPMDPTPSQAVLWTAEHPTAIAHNIDITGDGAYLITGWYLNDEHTSKYAVQGSGIPIWEYAQTPNYYIPVSASDDGNVMASTGDITPLNVWLNGEGPTPSWQFSYPAWYKASDCDVSDDGTYVASVCKQSSGNNGKLFVFDSSSSDPIWEVDFDGESQVNGVEISEDNNWILVTTYWNIYVYDLSSMSLFYTGNNYSQTMGGIDATAEWLVSGDYNGYLHVYQRTETGYVERWSQYIGGWITAVDISSDASTILAGMFTYSPYYAGEVEAIDIDGNLLWSYDQYGDFVPTVALCNDGSVGVAGSWGQYEVTYGDVFTAFDVSSGDVIFQILDDIDEPGSIFEVAISDDGTYATCGGKAVHARAWGNGGQIYSIELGAPVPPDVSITLTPYSPPIQIPSGGGSFDYAVALDNNEASPVTLDVWTMVQLPNGSWIGPVIGPLNLTLPAGTALDRDRTQYVPAHAPSGTYTYEGRIGLYPDDIWDGDSFTFEKLSTVLR